MMTTPIYDFVSVYGVTKRIRMHMPGHKGHDLLGFEKIDITEIDGADELYAPKGIIAESEENVSRIFGCKTVYSTEGSSLCIRAMLYLAVQEAIRRGQKPVIAAARNVHKTFLTAAALLDFDIIWIPQTAEEDYLCCKVTPERIAAAIAEAGVQPVAVYLTSPDYLGNICDVAAAAAWCHDHDMLLIVDNAHGAYLRFLEQPLHPIALGADICCDSAHKTLPVLTGGAYLHLADNAPSYRAASLKSAMAMFASTSPSYLILTALDRCNDWLFYEGSAAIQRAVKSVKNCREMLTLHGWKLLGDEPLKLTIAPKTCGWTGTELAKVLEENRIICEFADQDHLVLMPSAFHTRSDFYGVTQALLSIPQRKPITELPPHLPHPERVMTPREAAFRPTERIPAECSVGRVCAELTLGCPPAVPIVMRGERINKEAADCFAYYGIREIAVTAN